MSNCKQLTVAELVILLQTMPQDALVVGETYGDRNGGHFPVEKVVFKDGKVVIEGDI